MTQMIHRHWCARCRNITKTMSEQTPAEVAQQPAVTCCKCNSITSYLESVPAPVEDPNDTSDPTPDSPRKPPSRQEWYDAGYAAGTYEPRFRGSEWLPCWDDPKYVPKHFRVNEDGTVHPIAHDTEAAPAVDVDDESTWQRG